MAAIDMFELSIIPAVLNNSESWTDVSQDALDALEELQVMFLRIVLQVPVSTPKLAMKWDFGMIGMKFRIMICKLTFMNSLMQVQYKWTVVGGLEPRWELICATCFSLIGST